MTFRTWDELSEAEQLCSEYSDLHKNVRGFRPQLSANLAKDVDWLRSAIQSLFNVEHGVYYGIEDDTLVS